MKRVEGPTLAEYAPTVRSLAERLRLFLRICEPVAFAHARGVIHRDLKPENIMVGPFGEVLVMDWGIAKLVPSQGNETTESDGADSGPISASRKTRHGTVLGTRGYMAPEQARGEVRIDARADIYALGAILSFLLDSVPPPESGPLSGVRPLQAIARKACRSEPVERYQDVALLMAEVGRFLAGDPVEAYQERPMERLGRFVRKHRIALLLVLAYLVMRILVALV
jgi:serine/threonine protein kinase